MNDTNNKINIEDWSVYIVQILITTFRALAWSDNYNFSLRFQLDGYQGEEGGAGVLIAISIFILDGCLCF